MDDLVYQLLTLVESDKKASGIGPENTITLSNITGSIKQSLNRLYKDGKIKVGDTMNDKYVRLV